MTRSDGPDEARTAFAGSMLTLTVERWGDAEREIVERADSVAIVAVDPDDRLILVRQRREAARRSLLELPAGTIEEGEEPLATARREFAEETLLRAATWRRGPVVFASPGYSRERIHFFSASDVTPAPSGSAAERGVSVERVGISELTGRVHEIEDAKTLAGVLLLLHERRAR